MGKLNSASAARAHSWPTQGGNGGPQVDGADAHAVEDGDARPDSGDDDKTGQQLGVLLGQSTGHGQRPGSAQRWG